MNKPISIKVPHVLDIIAIGDEHGVILPAELLERLGVSGNEKLDVVEGPEDLTLRRHDADFADAMAHAEIVMEEDRAILAVLAK